MKFIVLMIIGGLAGYWSNKNINFVKMIECEELNNVFKKNGLTFFSGIPDSTFKEWMECLSGENDGSLTNIIACNECEAIAIAVGYHLSTGKTAVVYMQNSGEGKTVNPLASLCDPEVYSIPVLLLIGWRGEPGTDDEPQHRKMGKITIPLLDVLGIPHHVLPEDIAEVEKVVADAKGFTEERKSPYAIIIKKGAFKEYKIKKGLNSYPEMTREDAIKTIVDNLDGSEAIVSTTGKTSRELFEYRISMGEKPRDFYTVGGMGCSASIANGIALAKPNKKIFIFDGDGAVLMQMGALATIGHYKAKNIYHIIFDNNSHDSTGGQPTVSATVDFGKVALACGYKRARIVEKKTDLEESIKEMKSLDGPQMVVVKIRKGSRSDLGRPTTTPLDNKTEFIKNLGVENA